MRVLLVEDDYAISQSIETMLKKEVMIVDTTDLGEDGLEIGKLYDYDIIILDLMLPGINGNELIQKIKPDIKTPIIILSAKDELDTKVDSLMSGADDYITKPFGTNELRARVNAHLRRDVREKKNSFSISGVIFRLNAKEAEINSKKVPLTKSEYEICEYLARHHGQTFTREQIYEAVFGFDGESDSSVISTHVKNIRGKLAEFHLSTIETIWGVGYKWV